MEIEVYCHTNLDDYKCKNWPNVFSCRPEIGDYVKSSSGEILKIVRITHGIERFDKNPYLDIELHK